MSIIHYQLSIVHSLRVYLPHHTLPTIVADSEKVNPGTEIAHRDADRAYILTARSFGGLRLEHITLDVVH